MIKTITKNYELDLIEKGKINIIIGKNSTGKTKILEKYNESNADSSLLFPREKYHDESNLLVSATVMDKINDFFSKIIEDIVEKEYIEIKEIYKKIHKNLWPIFNSVNKINEKIKESVEEKGISNIFKLSLNDEISINWSNITKNKNGQVGQDVSDGHKKEIVFYTLIELLNFFIKEEEMKNSKGEEFKISKFDFSNYSIMIDEIENSFNPILIKKIIFEIFKWNEKSGGTIIITTHSPVVLGLIRDLDPFFKNINLLKRIKNEEEYFTVKVLKKGISNSNMDLLSNLNVLSSLFENRTIFTEGKTDKVYLDKILREININNAVTCISLGSYNRFKEFIKNLNDESMDKYMFVDDIDWVEEKTKKEIKSIEKRSNTKNMFHLNFGSDIIGDINTLIKEAIENKAIKKTINLSFFFNNNKWECHEKWVKADSSDKVTYLKNIIDQKITKNDSFKKLEEALNNFME